MSNKKICLVKFSKYFLKNGSFKNLFYLFNEKRVDLVKTNHWCNVSQIYDLILLGLETKAKYIYKFFFNNRTRLECNRMGKVSRRKHVFHITIYFGIIYTFISGLNWKNNNKLKIFTWWHIPKSTWFCIFKEIQISILNIFNHKDSERDNNTYEYNNW